VTLPSVFDFEETQELPDRSPSALVCVEGAGRLIRAALVLGIADARAGSADAIEWLRTGTGRQWVEALYGARGLQRLGALLGRCEPREDYRESSVRLPLRPGRSRARRG
jgi:hypothetical protein